VRPLATLFLESYLEKDLHPAKCIWISENKVVPYNLNVLTPNIKCFGFCFRKFIEQESNSAVHNETLISHLKTLTKVVSYIPYLLNLSNYFGFWFNESLPNIQYWYFPWWTRILLLWNYLEIVHFYPDAFEYCKQGDFTICGDKHKFQFILAFGWVYFYQSPK